MAEAELIVIVPSRGRPQAVARTVEAWRATGAYVDGARLVYAVDEDDPTADGYRQAERDAGSLVRLHWVPRWAPMVHKLDGVARVLAVEAMPYALGFAGDDHVPRTPGWAGRYLDALRELGTGIVYCDDGYQGANLPTQWAMTTDIVAALERMVPAPVEHLYCDNAILDLGRGAACIRYLDDVLIEHMHPAAGKASSDDQYRRVNGREQYRRDRAAYRQWLAGGLSADVTKVRALRQKVNNG